jgi:glyoxylase-like metal-dependent hydrolase (beta-lactamase superfamily II)
MEHELFIKQLKPSIYLFDEDHSASGYLVVGENKACLIDTMNGYCNLYEAVRKITDKPIIVVNTHGHPDHIFGNIYFDNAFMNPADNELAESFTNIPEFADACKKYGFSLPPFTPITEGDVIDLGGKTLEIYNIPGHTQGSILLLLKEDRILFVGDSINHHLWMQVPGATKMDDFVKSLETSSSALILRLRYLFIILEPAVKGTASVSISKETFFALRMSILWRL